VVRLALGLLLGLATGAAAIDTIDAEEDIAELLATPPSTEAEEEETQGRKWAVLPQVGYGPETGPLAGFKFEHRNLAGEGITLDVDATYALNRQQNLGLTVGSEHLREDRFLLLFSSNFELDPQLDFFGIGNNDVGPDAASTHEFQSTDAELTGGWRPWPRLALNGSIGLRRVSVRRGDRDDDTPFTIDEFPNLPGIDGGWANPIALSLVYSSRDEIMRPTRGVRAIAKISHTNKALGSDFEFTRYTLDASYLYSFLEGRHVLGARIGGGFIDGPTREIPFWELEELGGDDTLRGFFPHRFLGQSRVMLNLEYRGKMVDFDFFDIWHVQVDGVLFGEAGRVFIDNDELDDEFELNEDIIGRIVDDLQYSYGGGLRIALSRALIARIDVGFSEEETGLVYLAFGHTF
jgi:outer membrane protein assembly factor BamA